MIAALLTMGLALGQDPWDADLPLPLPDLDAARGSADERPLALAGIAVGGVGGGSGVALSQAAVVGGDGGTTVWTAQTQVRWDSWVIGARLPFATFRDAAVRDTGLGNLRIDLAGIDSGSASSVRYGVELHLPVGDAWTWVNDAQSVWPGAGLNLVYGRQWAQSDQTTLLVRTAAGLHVTQGYAPFPATVFKAEVAAAVDQQVADRVAIVGEASLAYWDPTPLDVAGLVRVDPLDGLRLRGGLVLPLLSWAGAQPSGVPAGVREATVHLDVAMAL